MPNVLKLTWRQASVDVHINAAIKAGLNDTMEACVRQAKINAPVLTGALREDIAYEPAKQSGSRITGRWGNWGVPYAVYQEYGTIYISPRHYLTRAKDQEYPRTNSRIRKHM